MNRSAFIPSTVAPLEHRIALSRAAGFSTAAVPAHILAQPASLNLYGLALGSDHTAGTLHRLRASDETIAPLGTVSLSGFLVIPHARHPNRNVHGTVTISNTQGSVVVSLSGTVTVYKGAVPFASGNLTYKIVSGTKAYHGATGTGAVLYGPGPVLLPGRFLLDFGHYPPPP
jgi:hypothetical protein